MTAVTRIRAVVENLLDRTVTNGVLIKIANGLLANAGADTTGTNEEKAQILLDLITADLRGKYMSSAVAAIQTSHAAEEAAAQNDAAGEMT